MTGRDRNPTLTERRVFNPVYDALWSGWAAATDHLASLSDAELWHAEEWAQNLGRTNCAWLVYKLRGDILQFIRWEANRRLTAQKEPVEGGGD